MYEIVIKQNCDRITLEADEYQDVELVASAIIAIANFDVAIEIKNKEFPESKHLENELRIANEKLKKLEQYAMKESTKESGDVE